MTRPPTGWGPYLFDDHGQPLCSTPDEEQRLWAELVADGTIPPPGHDSWDDPTWDPDTEPPY